MGGTRLITEEDHNSHPNLQVLQMTKGIGAAALRKGKLGTIEVVSRLSANVGRSW